MRRSELASFAGCHGETVRFYEQRGLLPAPPLNPVGHRVYGPEHARRLRFILRGRELGFGLEEIAQLLRLPAEDGPVCAAARALASARLDETRQKLTDLARLERALASIVARCDAGAPDVCAVIDALSERSALPRGGGREPGPRRGCGARAGRR
jgi:MerR family mercuric resistance operon transcriptional regulator